MHYVSIQNFNGGNEIPLYTSAALTSGAPHSSSGKIKFVNSKILIDNGSLIDSLKNQIIIKQAGVYRINSSCTAKVNSNISSYKGAWWMQIVVNNNEKSQQGVELGNLEKHDRHTATTEVIMSLQPGDAIDVRIAPQGVSAPVIVYAFSINIHQLV